MSKENEIRTLSNNNNKNHAETLSPEALLDTDEASFTALTVSTTSGEAPPVALAMPQSTSSEESGIPCSFSPSDWKKLCDLLGLSQDDQNTTVLADFMESCSSISTLEDLAFLKEEDLNESFLSREIQQKLLLLANVFLQRQCRLLTVNSKLSKSSTVSPPSTDRNALVTLDVGGIKFQTTRDTLCRAPDSVLEAMFSRWNAFPSQDGSFVINRDGTHFHHILNYLRVGTLVSLPSDEDSREALAVEADYYGLKELLRLIRTPQKVDIHSCLSEKTQSIRQEENVLRKDFMYGTAAASLDCHESLVTLFSLENPFTRLALKYEPADGEYSSVLLGNLREKAPHGTPVAVTTMDDFRSNFQRKHPDVLDRLELVLLEEKVVIAGGSVLEALTTSPESLIRTSEWWGKNKSDVDIFLYCDGPEEANRVAQRIFFALAVDDEQWVIMRSRGVITMHQWMDDGQKFPDLMVEKVQIVLRLYDSPVEVLLGFDCDCCCCAYDGRRVLASPRCLEALRTGINVLNPLHSWPNKASYELRLAKYAYRGFPIAVPGLMEKYVDYDRIHRTDLCDLKGLARLLRVAAEMNPVAWDGDFPHIPQCIQSLRPEVKNCCEMLGGYEDGNGKVFIPDEYLRRIRGFLVPNFISMWWYSEYVPLANECREEVWNEILTARFAVPEGVSRLLADAWDDGKRSREYLNSTMDTFDLDNAYYCQAYKQDG